MAAALALMVSAGVLGYVGWTRRNPVAPATHRAPPGTTRRAGTTPIPRTARAARYLTEFGVASRAMEAENERPGTTSWRIPAEASTRAIQGFADHVAAIAGDTVGLYVSAPARFHVEAYRMGYYGGTGARLVWQSGDIAASPQPHCLLTKPANTVSCANWSRTLTFRVTRQFVPGDYLLKLVGPANEQSYVPLTVWDPASHAAYLVKNDVYTWQAWNAYGGYDFYTGPGSCPPNVYPLCSRARVASFDRPYAFGAGAGDFMANEYPLVQFVEQHGLDVTYATDLTVEQHPEIVTAHRALLSLGHDECWSLHERLAVVAAEVRGVNLVFFAASPILRHVRLAPSSLGPGRIEIDYRNSAEDPLNGRGDPREVTGNTWGSPPASWSASPFVGATYAGFLENGAPSAPFVVADGQAWIFARTGLHTGARLPNVLASDFDEFDPASHPPSEQILGHSPIPLRHAQSLIGRQDARVYSDMTYYTDPRSHAGVFDSGTNNWIPALVCAGCPSNIVQTMTANLLWLFGQAPAGTLRPSTPNWQRIYSSRT